MDEEFVPCSNFRGVAPKSRMKFRKRSQGEYPFQFVCCGHCFDLWGSERRHAHGKNCFLNKNSYYVVNPEYDPTYNPAVRERAVNYEETTTEDEDEDEPRRRRRSRIGTRIPPKREASKSRGEKGKEKHQTSVGRKERRSRPRGPRSSNKRSRSRFRK